MQRDKIKPILFSIIKHSSKEELKRQLPKDVLSGVMVAVVALPLSIALAIASGVNPEQGLYTAIVAGFLIAFLGGSPGIMLAMRVFRHKTLHTSFAVGMPLICFFEAVLIAAALIYAAT